MPNQSDPMAVRQSSSDGRDLRCSGVYHGNPALVPPALKRGEGKSLDHGEGLFVANKACRKAKNVGIVM
jgi:hypothetical protein